MSKRLRPGVVGSVTLLTCLLLGVWTSSDAYRLTSYDRSLVVPSAAEAVTWSPAAWPPGGTLDFHVADSPLWELGLPDADAAVRVVERALGLWSSIPTADIRWRAAGPTRLRLDRGEPTRDGISSIVVASSPDHDDGISYSTRRYQNRTDRVRGSIVECDIVISQHRASQIADEASGYRGFDTIVHELGHCLGLRHSGPHPGFRRNRYGISREDFGFAGPGVWGIDPVMAYGKRYNRIATDDAVGASLLRPADGFLESTGAIRGRVAASGRPVAFAHVLAMPLRDGQITEDTVGGFADDKGDFLIEGLPPGQYVLFVHPINWFGGLGSLLDDAVPMPFAETVQPVPVRVVARAETTEVVIEVVPAGDDEARPTTPALLLTVHLSPDVLNPQVMTLQPGQWVRARTNYGRDQNKVVADWTSSNPSVARVHVGLGRDGPLRDSEDISIEAVAPGEATLTATYEGATRQVEVIVAARP